MGFKTWATNDYLTAADVNDFLMEQAVIRVTSGTRPSAPNEGMFIYENDTNRYCKYNADTPGWEYVAGSTVTTFQPALSATTTPPTLGVASQRLSHYTYLPGPKIHYFFLIKFGTSGTAAGNGQYRINLPVTSASPLGASFHSSLGKILIADASASAFRTGVCFIPGSDLTTMQLIAESNTLITEAAPWAWGASDYISGDIIYPI